MTDERCPICDRTGEEAGPHIHPKGEPPSLRAEMRRVLTRVEQLLEAIAPEEEEPDPTAPHPGFQRFRNKQGGQRG